MRNRMEKENDVTTFTEDQIEKIRETLGDEAVAKLTLPKVRVPKYVSGQWLVDHAQVGVRAVDTDGDTTTYCEDGKWEGWGCRPSAHSDRAFVIEEWPNGEIYDNCPPPERAEAIKVADGSDRGELKVGDTIESINQLDSLPVGSVVACDTNFPWTKYMSRGWIHVYDERKSSSEVVYSMMSKCRLTILRVGWRS